MMSFYFKKLTILGIGKPEAVIEFNENLNIIHGRSNTGKTRMLKCLDCVMGSKDFPQDERLGYNTITVDVCTSTNEIITFMRIDIDNLINHRNEGQVIIIENTKNLQL
jgi:predicted ATP-dependent endonuclease of OLD family